MKKSTGVYTRPIPFLATPFAQLFGFADSFEVLGKAGVKNPVDDEQSYIDILGRLVKCGFSEQSVSRWAGENCGQKVLYVQFPDTTVRKSDSHCKEIRRMKRDNGLWRWNCYQ